MLMQGPDEVPGGGTKEGLLEEVTLEKEQHLNR